ncbi:unnamed protein product [Owenia fusiformis]|uniref:Uncharacterized protein n=1 Tax=Owenia fusiformis TaxID=6347 RepID=A0A8J1TZ56_OWEFU|nr:unnamed protein product [Owenia fusiformis]
MMVSPAQLLIALALFVPAVFTAAIQAQQNNHPLEDKYPVDLTSHKRSSRSTAGQYEFLRSLVNADIKLRGEILSQLREALATVDIQHMMRLNSQIQANRLFEKNAMEKKDAFWQPMGGPLPIETRLASFGRPIVQANADNGAKPNPMRYGKRR